MELRGRAVNYRRFISDRITLADHDTGHGHTLPSPDFLLLHASLARVFYASGAAERIDQILRDVEETRVLAADGSTDASVLLMAHLTNTASSWPNQVRGVVY